MKCQLHKHQRMLGELVLIDSQKYGVWIRVIVRKADITMPFPEILEVSVLIPFFGRKFRTKWLTCSVGMQKVLRS